MRIRENRQKNEIKLVEYFGIGNDGRVSSDSGKAFFSLNQAPFPCRNGKYHCAFHYYSLFFSNIQLFWLYNCSVFNLHSHSAPLFTSNKSRSTDDFRCQSNFAILAQWCFSAVEKEKKDSLQRLCPSVFLLRLRFVWPKKHVTSVFSHWKSLG